MTDNNHEDPQVRPDEEPATEEAAGGDEFDVPQDASQLLDPPEAGADIPAEASAAERAGSPDGTAAQQSDAEQALAERTADLQRLQAEYVNYKRRVDRDRDLARTRGIEAVIVDLLPVLDGISAAEQHDELTGGFKMVADELAKVAAKYGLATFGEVGEPFDPTQHEALMHVPFEGDHEVTVVSAVMQRGAKLNDRVIRPARVGVADPD
ncbi:MAG: nucleotide exchange factor GrpE [Propioniciclava sp.]